MSLDLVDELQTLTILSSLSNNWEIIVVSISTYTVDGKFTLKKMKDNILNEKRKKILLSLMHLLQKLRWEDKVGFHMISKIKNLVVEKVKRRQ